MTQPRRIARCEECGESREMATKHECFACYRSRKRAEDQPIDRHNPGLRREHQKLLKGYANLITALYQLRIARPHVVQIRDLVAPYLAPVADFLPRIRERELSVVHGQDEDQVDAGSL